MSAHSDLITQPGAHALASSVPFMFIHYGAQTSGYEQFTTPAGITDARKVGRFPDLMESALDARLKNTYAALRSERERAALVTRTVFSQQAGERRWAAISGERDKQLREALLAHLSPSGVGRSQSQLFASVTGRSVPRALVAEQMALDVAVSAASHSARVAAYGEQRPERRVSLFASNLERAAMPHLTDPRLVKPLDADVVASSARMLAAMLVGTLGGDSPDSPRFEIAARAVAFARASYLETGDHGPFAAPLLGVQAMAGLFVSELRSVADLSVQTMLATAGDSTGPLVSVQNSLSTAKEKLSISEKDLLLKAKEANTALKTATEEASDATAAAKDSLDNYSGQAAELAELLSGIEEAARKYSASTMHLENLRRLGRESGLADSDTQLADNIKTAQRAHEASRAQLEARLTASEKLRTGSKDAFAAAEKTEQTRLRTEQEKNDAIRNFIAVSQNSARTTLAWLLVKNAESDVSKVKDVSGDKGTRQEAAVDLGAKLQILGLGRWDLLAQQPQLLGDDNADIFAPQRTGAVLADVLAFELSRARFSGANSATNPATARAEQRRTEQARRAAAAIARLRNELIVAGESQALANLAGRCVLPFALTYDFSVDATVDDHASVNIVSEQSRTLF